MSGPAQTSEPYIQYLYQLIDAVRLGRLRIPRFQRRVVWEWERQAELLRSVRDGIPMGAVMVWRTNGARIGTLETLEGHPLPSPPEGPQREYLLDGFQRVSTVFSALHGPGDQCSETGTRVFFDLVNLDFVVPDELPESGAPMLPLTVLLDSVQLLRFQRGLEGSDTERWIEESDRLAAAFREYKVPVIPILSDALEVATRAFKLLNTQGVQMSEADMVHALTWTPEFELRERLEALRAEVLAPIGWDDVDDEKVVLKVMKAGFDLDLYDRSAVELSEWLRKEPDKIDRAVHRIARTASFVKTECGVRSYSLLPYAFQAVFLADVIPDEPVLDELAGLLRDWFWLTTYGEMFAGMSGYRIHKALADLRESIADDELRWSGARTFRRSPLAGTSFDFRAVRAKALALMLARAQDEGTADQVGASRILSLYGRRAVPQLVPRRELDAGSYSSPGNRFLCAPEDVAELRRLVMEGEVPSEVRRAHLIPDDAVEAGKAGDWSGFVTRRLAHLDDQEQAFVSEIEARRPLR